MPEVKELKKCLTQLYHLVGNTPMLEIYLKAFGKKHKIYAKVEFANNMTGSIKDRMALHIICEAYKNNIIQKGAHIIEATSGNTGISFAAIGRALGHPVTIVMPDWMCVERKRIIKGFGAELIEISAAEGGFTGSIARTEEIAAADGNVFLPKQFANTDNTKAHFDTTGPEIYEQLQSIGKTPTAFVAGVGTGGTVMGVGQFLKSKISDVTIHPLEPENSPTLRTGGKKIGSHRIQGISDEFIPAIVDLNYLDDIVDADDGDAILMAQKLSQTLGLGVGISSGANFVGAIKKQIEKGDDAIVVTVFPDDNKKYLSTDLFNDEPVKPGFITPEVELTGFHVVPRLANK